MRIRGAAAGAWIFLCACGATKGSPATVDAGADARRDDAGGTDARPHDAAKSSDAARDVGVDAVTKPDAPVDARQEAAADASHDSATGVDASPDAARDAAVDAPVDAPGEGSRDAGVDAPVVSPWSAHVPNAEISAVAVDSEHNTLVGGSGSPGSPYFAQYDATGAPIWNVGFSGGGQTNAAAADSSDHALFGGEVTETVDFGGGPLTGGGAFVAEFDTNGNYLFAHVYPSASVISAIATATGWIVVGWFEGTTDFGTGPLTSSGFDATFVLGLDAAGNTLFSRGFSGAGNATPSNVALDSSGDIVISGEFDGTVNFGGGVLTGPVANGGQHASYLLKLDSSGAFLAQATFHVTGTDVANSAAVDPSGDIVVVGTFGTRVDCGGGNLNSQGSSDVFLCELDSSLAFKWGKSFGDSNVQEAAGVAIDPAGDIVIAGSMQGDVSFGGGLLDAPALSVFVAKYDGTGAYLTAGVIGSTTSAYTLSMAAPTSGPSEVIAGAFQGVMDFGQGPFTSSGNAGDGFVAWWVP